ncbi:type II 3-dehydroquinate dehydratase [candidate division KSB1 bacterium]|nr:type II 3-dehydroquinate dehydratase [candidate division KSB1 bacterium]
MYNILVVHGPNLNLLGEREPDVYGVLTLADIDKRIKLLATELNAQVKCYQSNHEGQIIDFLHDNRKWSHGLVINPGALTHYSYALRDAIAAIHIPAVEIHLSNIYEREAFRQHSVTLEVCIGQKYGRGLESYLDGLRLLVEHMSEFGEKTEFEKKSQ